jgi:1-deoxy-D-xylulose-5-phosphate synthase
MKYAVFSKVHFPSDLRSLSEEELALLAEELRYFIQTETSTKAGHIKSSLGVVELTIVLHYFFNTPQDILIWDVGHQAYVHKVLTGRKDQFTSNRQKDGISGFTRREESPYDPFGAGHSSTSISALAGFVKAEELAPSGRKHIAVIGDGAITGGQAFEALNYLGELGQDCLVVLNDNNSSIDANVGALQAQGFYKNWIESLGFSYHYCEAGNTINSLLSALANCQEQGPMFLHIKTQKALGYWPELSRKNEREEASFQAAFGTYILDRLGKDDKLVVLSPAMLSGAKLSLAKKAYPTRVIDVGIAEQHCVTMAAGLAASGFKPIVHLYSTFAQRAMDQVIHDVALQNLGVVFVLDRAGLVGEDGPTHHGVFDQSLLSDVPGIRCAAPSGRQALVAMLDEALETPSSPIFLRFPKAEYDIQNESLWRSFRPHWWHKDSVENVIISYGTASSTAQKAAISEGWGHLHIPIFRPVPLADLKEQIQQAKKVVLIDENPKGGSLHLDLVALFGLSPFQHIRYQAHILEHPFIPHASREEQLSLAGLQLTDLLATMRRDL